MTVATNHLPMYRLGHQGLNLVVFAPVLLAAALAGHLPLGVLAVGIGFTTASLPDADHSLPLVAHRGITHTVWAALAVGAAGAGLTWLAAGVYADLLTTLGVTRAVAAAAVGGSLALSILGHLCGDVLTPMGIRPLHPLSRRSYTLSVCPADSWLGNRLLFGVGVAATVTAVGALAVV